VSEHVRGEAANCGPLGPDTQAPAYVAADKRRPFLETNIAPSLGSDPSATRPSRR
jgi:hypothetical protein